MPVIFYSTVDQASENIALALKQNHGFEEKGNTDLGEKQFAVWACGQTQLVELHSPLPEADFLKDFFKSDLFVFASRHQSVSGAPCATVHAPGNWAGETKYGGNANELQLTSAKALQCFYDLLKANPLPVFREASHHGPTCLKTPSVFVELGSSEKEWSDYSMAEPIAEAIVEGCRSFSSKNAKAALGFGGNHYLAGFENLPFALSHVASKYVLDFVDAAMVKQAVEKTAEPVEKAFVDWTGCSKEQREMLVASFEKTGLSWEKA
ncbi:TPA: hypothetical protein HA244_01065 [Candidatus Micrarchaeota archaeon]|nr:hypothetical protein [Candidatus Micrarchaeota archaeon]